jgi:hypothetical protein
MRKAWLHIRDGYCWEFEAIGGDSLFHRTRYGNLYAILTGVGYGKPFWVGRCFASVWASWEGTLGARRIEFEGGGVYTFPGKR